MNTRHYQSRQSGFTLVELLLAITLMAMLLALAYGGLSATTKATYKGQELLEESGSIRVTHQFIRRQLNQMQPLAFDVTQDIEERQVVFEGSIDRIRFVAPMPGYLGRGGPQVQYLEFADGADGLELLFSHQLLQGFDPIYMIEREPIMLLDGVEDAQFEFLKADENGVPQSWSNAWDTPDLLPLAVRLDITFADNRQTIWPLLITGVKIDSAAMAQSSQVSPYSNAIQRLIQKSEETPR
jgi:general secretion pathway protein J